MSLWRVKHTLPPAVEYGLVAAVAACGFFAVYMTSLRPFLVIATPDIRSVAAQVSLDADRWQRHDDPARGLVYGLPPGWLMREDGAGRLAAARAIRLLPSAGEGEGLLIETIPLGERRQIENLAAEEFDGRRPALYDVWIDGRHGLFAVEFERARVRRQVVYVAMDGRALILRGGITDPAVFATFVSTVKFVGAPLASDPEPEDSASSLHPVPL